MATKNLRKFARFINRNIVMIVMVPTIIGLHWGWSELQKLNMMPELGTSEAKVLPTTRLYRFFKSEYFGFKDEEKEAKATEK